MKCSVYIFWSILVYSVVQVSSIETEVPYTVIVLLSISPFNSVVCFIYLGALRFGIDNFYIFLVDYLL